MNKSVVLNTYPFVLRSQTLDSYQLTLASPDMAGEIMTLVNESYCVEKTRKPGTFRYSDASEISEEIQKAQSVAWLVLQDPSNDNKIIGSLELAEESGRNHINAFAVDKDYRGRGLGPKLLKVAESMLKTKGVAKVYLSVISVATESLPEVKEWTMLAKEFQAEDDSLASFYQEQGFNFTHESTLTPLSWQRECRKDAFVGRVFFREMCKSL